MQRVPERHSEPARRGATTRHVVRRLRHPDAASTDLAERAAQVELGPVLGWTNDYGWLVVLYASDRRVRRTLPPASTVEDARRVARDALKADPTLEKAWIVKKTTRNQEK